MNKNFGVSTNRIFQTENRMDSRNFRNGRKKNGENSKLCLWKSLWIV